MNALLVSYSFPPCGGTGVMRVSSLARFFPAEGIRVDVLTARNAAAVGVDTGLLRSIPDEVTIHRTLTLDLPFGIKKSVKRLLTGKRTASNHNARTDQRETKGRFAKMIADVLSPDPQVTWIPVLKRSATTLIRKRDIDIVIITVPPFSSLLLAEYLRNKFPHLPVVLDFRDEWLTTTFSLVSFLFNNTEKARRVAERIESRAITAATLVVAVTEAARQQIRARYPHEPEGKFRLVSNGFDAASIVKTPARSLQRTDSQIVVTFVGTVYASTEPSSLVEALESLPIGLRNRFKLRFIGHIENDRYREMLLRLGDMVELKGFLPQHSALDLMKETDYVLLINHDPLNVGGKFYDYVGSGKPILGAVHPDGETRRLLEELRAGWWAGDRDGEAIRRLFMDAASRADLPGTAFHPDFERIAQFERKPLAQRYARLLHSIADQPSIEEPSEHEAVTARESN